MINFQWNLLRFQDTYPQIMGERLVGLKVWYIGPLSQIIRGPIPYPIPKPMLLQKGAKFSDKTTKSLYKECDLRQTLRIEEMKMMWPDLFSFIFFTTSWVILIVPKTLVWKTVCISLRGMCSKWLLWAIPALFTEKEHMLLFKLHGTLYNTLVLVWYVVKTHLTYFKLYGSNGITNIKCESINILPGNIRAWENTIGKSYVQIGSLWHI